MARSRSRSRVALPTKAALIGAAEPAAALHLGRGIMHGLGGAKCIGADAPALCGASDRRVADNDDLRRRGRPSVP